MGSANDPDDFARALASRPVRRQETRWAGGDIARILGVLLTAIGSFASYMYILKPVQAVAANAPLVEYNAKAALLAPFMLGAGIVLTIFGSRAGEILDRNTDSRLRWVAGGLVVAGVGIALWMDGYLRSHGYSR